MFFLGLDLGSTTVKFVLLDERGEIVAKAYMRHKSEVVGTLSSALSALKVPSEGIGVVFSGSGALGIAQSLGVEFLQEVVADRTYLKNTAGSVDVAVELGGEDAKLLYLTNGIELRMNEACAGGTGAFIDQMALLLDTDAAGLNALASQAKGSYPIASRCGVFAKTDLVSLLNSGVSREDIARSVFEAVTEQTISGLACGRPIAGRIAFLGGPLAFLSSLREAFERKLAAPGTEFLTTDNREYAVAMGAALRAREKKTVDFSDIPSFLKALKDADVGHTVPTLPTLFKSEAEKEAFKARHAKETVKEYPLSEATGPLYLGVDLGSTTVKGVLIDKDGLLRFSWYENNEGHPLERLFERLKKVLTEIPEGAYIQDACTTGYGADLAKAALGASHTEVETLAHEKAAAAFDPEVSYVIDIGGQDMKCMAVSAGRITSVKLNEACSSGCGSFLQTFAAQLGLTLPQFVAAAERSTAPCDLGTRCTVFMTSMVRQAQRAGSSLEDISAGLCRSVVRNALYKVLRVRNAEDLGSHVVVQGGTFLNDAVLRSFELETGLNVIRPSIAGLMGAYGAALIAKERSLTEAAPIALTSEALTIEGIIRRDFRCRGCANHCLLQMNRFKSGAKYVSGNRCDFGMHSGGAKKKAAEGFVERKLRLLFDRPVLDPASAPEGTIGIPRVLNMYEHYPYWNALFTTLGFAVVLSGPSDKKTLAAATGTIPSQSLCFPAKLAHGHVVELAERGVKRVWLPCVPREGTPFKEADGRFACPVVAGYPEALRLNMRSSYPELSILTPFLDLQKDATVEAALHETFPWIVNSRIRAAILIAKKAQDEYRLAVTAVGHALWDTHRKSDRPLVILAGHPYHADPLISNGIPALIESMGADLVTEDAVCDLLEETEKTDVVNQWTFHSRLYRAAKLAATSPKTELVQLVSFGCGIDAITSEEVSRILEAEGKLYTQLKIDEGDTLGAAKIRLKSLLAALGERARSAVTLIKEKPVRFIRKKAKSAINTVRETVTKKHSEHTLYAPQMAPIHFPILGGAFKDLGWNVKLLTTARPEAAELGLKHVNNDACYPAIVVIGQLLDAVLNDPEFDKEKDAVLLAQTCGPCRASNYPTLMRWALDDVGCGNVPVVSLSAGNLGTETLDLGVTGIVHLMRAVVCGDLLQRLTLYTRAHEVTKGEAEKKLAYWQERLAKRLPKSKEEIERVFAEIVKDYAGIALDGIKKPAVGIVGEILLKYHPQANKAIIDRILAAGAVPVLGDLAMFFNYCLTDYIWQAKKMGGGKLKGAASWVLLHYFEGYRNLLRAALSGMQCSEVLSTRDLVRGLKGIVSPGQQAGEGWLLTAEMIEFLDHGVTNVLCLQPFGCLPNHVTGKGVIRELRETRPQANLCAIDFEPGTSETNVDNRLKLFLAQAFENLAAEKSSES